MEHDFSNTTVRPAIRGARVVRTIGVLSLLAAVTSVPFASDAVDFVMAALAIAFSGIVVTVGHLGMHDGPVVGIVEEPAENWPARH